MIGADLAVLFVPFLDGSSNRVEAGTDLEVKVMFCGGITKDVMSKSKVDPCRVCSQRAKTNTVLCLQCGKWIHGRCAGMKRVTPKSQRNTKCRKCEVNIGKAVEQEEKLCNEMKTVSEFTYLSETVSVGGGCEAAVTARTRCGWDTLRECGELLYGRRFPLRLKGAVHKLCKTSNTASK